MLLFLLACVPSPPSSPGSETGSPPASSPGDPPHGCAGTMLRAVWDGALDGDALVAELEAALGELSCWANEPAGFVECTLAEDPCGDASAGADRFLAQLAAFDPRFVDYPYGVVETCACRSY